MRMKERNVKLWVKERQRARSETSFTEVTLMIDTQIHERAVVFPE
jgi:hypothetical protein